MKEKNLYNITFIKTIMMMLVVLYHSLRYFTGNWFNIYGTVNVSTIAIYIADFLKLLHVPVFFMASGFLYFYLKVEKGKYNNLNEDIKNKFKRLIVPYISTCLLWAIPIGTYFYHHAFKTIINKYVLMSSPDQLWFLITLFNVFLIFFIVLSKLKINTKNLIFIYIIGTTLSMIFERLGIHFFQIDSTMQYCLFFYLGGYIYTYSKKINIKKIVIFVILTIILLALKFIFEDNSEILYYVFRFFNPLISVLETIIVYYICTKIINFNSFIHNKFWTILVVNSFGIYLFHQQIIYMVIALFRNSVSSFVLVLLSFVISILISLGITLILRKNRITQRIFGL